MNESTGWNVERIVSIRRIENAVIIGLLAVCAVSVVCLMANLAGASIWLAGSASWAVLMIGYRNRRARRRNTVWLSDDRPDRGKR